MAKEYFSKWFSEPCMKITRLLVRRLCSLVNRSYTLSLKKFSPVDPQTQKTHGRHQKDLAGSTDTETILGQGTSKLSSCIFQKWPFCLLGPPDGRGKLTKLFFFLKAAPTAYWSSGARGWIRATTTYLHHSHSNAGSKPHLHPAPQLTTMPDP